MAVVAGIDEAGYGPILGPLVVSATAFRVPDAAAEGSLWELFGTAVTQKASRKGDRLQVADSKVVHRGGNVRALEQNLLPFLGLLWPTPSRLKALADILQCENCRHIAAYPWYHNCDLSLPRCVPVGEISDRLCRLRDSLAAAGGGFCGARAELLDVAEFNREVRACDCKSVPLARRVAVLMDWLWTSFGHEGLALTVDKQGGRDRYSTFLRAAFPDARIVACEETAARSTYEVIAGPRRARIRFEPRADANHLPVALASMLSKYLRELFVEMLNQYWQARVPNLKPTSGYYTDGQRFLKDIEPARAAEGIPLDLLVRCR